MELINDNIKNNSDFQILTKVFSYSYANKDKTRGIISYDEFKDVLTAFIEKIMNDYLTLSNVEGNPEFIITHLSTLGTQDFDKIKIDNDVIRGLYLGNLLEIVIIFHELIHFKYDIDIFTDKVVNINILRIIKEDIIRIDSINRQRIFPYDYYVENYSKISNEVISDLESVELLKKMLLLMNIELNEIDKDELNNFYDQRKCDYLDKERDFRKCTLNDNDYQDFEEYFDVIVRFNKNCITELPQLQIEYYLDKDGNVCKRTIDELKTLLEASSDDGIKEYIAYLLNQAKSQVDIKAYKHIYK